jgi:hypothetical protein
MLYSSLAYAGVGSIVGVAVLLAGLPLLFIAGVRPRLPGRRKRRRT